MSLPESKLDSWAKKERLLKESAPPKEKIKEVVISEIQKGTTISSTSEVNVFFATSIVRVEMNSASNKGNSTYDFVYKESKENEVLRLIRGVITFNYLWKEILKIWVEIGHQVKTKPPEDMGIITGRVINALTHNPMAGVLVYGEEHTKTPHGYTLSYRTNNEGCFSIEYIPVGSYYIYAKKEGFTKSLLVGVEVKKDKRTDLEVISLLPRETSKITLLKGRVIDKSTTPIMGATVYLENSLEKKALSITTTNLKGEYTLSLVSLGRYKLVASKESISNYVNLTITEDEATKKQVIKVEDIIFSNHPPFISLLKADRKIIGVNETTVIKVKAKDLDNDRLWYYWGCDKGNFIQIGEEEAIWQTPFINGTYQVSVTVKDKKSGEAFSSINLPICYSIKTKDILPVDLCYHKNLLYLVDNKSNYIRQFSLTKGEEVSKILVSLPQPQFSFSGITYDGSQFYIADKENDKIYKVSKKGEIISSFNSPGDTPQGLAYDGKHIWNVDYRENKLYKINPENGEVISSFNSSGSSPRGLAFDGSYLWNSDSGSDFIYKIDFSTGVVVASFSAPRGDPRGLVYDGTYLWCIDEGVATIYRLKISDYL
ncbi:carboxypeptidase regulatory-like domain-containing protein [bacterium]|nr:carboxypeptidase regulatory-like domain-containing protein [bacterium]